MLPNISKLLLGSASHSKMMWCLHCCLLSLKIPILCGWGIIESFWALICSFSQQSDELFDWVHLGYQAFSHSRFSSIKSFSWFQYLLQLFPVFIYNAKYYIFHNRILFLTKPDVSNLNLLENKIPYNIHGILIKLMSKICSCSKCFNFSHPHIDFCRYKL